LCRSQPKGRRYAPVVVLEIRTNSLLSTTERERRNFIAMPPRRREIPIPNPAVEREMCELHARLDSIETTQRQIVDVGDIIKVESENEAGNEGEEFAVEDVAEERLFRVVARIGVREKMDIPMYEGNLDVEEILV
jgi:hypothetical protein